MWTRGELEDLVRGRIVLAADETGAVADAPGWAVAVAERELALTAGVVVEATHPEDRPALVNAMVDVVTNPGALVARDVRTDVLGEWSHVDVAMVNLLGHPDARCVLAAVRVTGLADPPSPEALRPANTGEADPSPWAMVTLDRSGMIESFEGHVERIFGCSAEELKTRNIVTFWHPDALEEVIGNFTALANSAGGVSSARRLMLRDDGSELWVEAHAFTRFDAASGEDRITAVLHDVSDRRAQEEELRRSHDELRRLADDLRVLAEDFRHLAEEVPSAVFRCDADGTLTFHNSHWAELLGRGADGAPLTVTRLHDVAAPDHRCAIDRLLHELDEGERQRTVEVRAADEQRTIALTCRSFRDEPTGGIRVLGSGHDVTATVALRHAARVDPLTGLLNRTAFEERLADDLAEDPTRTRVVFMDLDNFKDVNDSHGHDAGDALLATVAERLRHAVRPDDAVGRFGGDEFVLVFRAADELDTALCRRLEEALAPSIDVDGGSWSPSASIGVATGRPGDDVAAILRRADEHMFAVKRARRA